MADTYPVGVFPGERPEKTLVRAYTYALVLQQEGLTQFREKHHLVLGGAGGDLRVLLALGVPQDHIHVAELQPKLVKNLNQRFPGMKIHKEDALLTLARCWREPFATLNLDLCGKLSHKNVAWIAAVMHADRHDKATTFITLCASREQDRDLNDAVQRSIDRGMRAGHARCAVLYDELRAEDPALNGGPFISYVSRGTSVKGMQTAAAMCTVVLSRRKLNMYGGRGRLVAVDEDDGVSARLLADSFHRHGLRAPAIAPILGLSTQQVAGWFASDTRRKQN